MEDRGIFDFLRVRPLALSEANDLIGVLNRVTAKHSKKVSELIAVLESLDPANIESTSQVEAKVNREIEDWNAKVRKLGAIPRGLWFIDIDSGDGYFCWKFPENEINYWHDYKSGFASRVSLHEKQKAELYLRPASKSSDTRGL